jgi:hypothetical protein
MANRVQSENPGNRQEAGDMTRGLPNRRLDLWDEDFSVQAALDLAGL